MKLFGNQFFHGLQMASLRWAEKCSNGTWWSFHDGEKDLLTQVEALEGAIFQETAMAGDQFRDMGKQSENSLYY